MPLLSGSRLGPYEISSPIGAGGMGEVYRARDPRLRRDVAIKVIPSDRGTDPRWLRRFADEARAAGALNHPSVLSVFDIGLDGATHYVVFELLEGDTLRHRLERGPLPPRKAIEYAVQICEGLAAAHEKGIVHRDLKPDNLFLTRDGRVKILDFGLAKLTAIEDGGGVSGTATRTASEPGLLLGTVAYMSPEQARGEPADARSDLFALGATLYEMLSGRPAFQRATPTETLCAILLQEPEEIGSSPGNPVPAALWPILRRCLEKDPAQRFQSARDLGFALNVLSTPGTNRVAWTPPLSWLRPPRRRFRLTLIAGVLAASAVASYVLRPSTRTQKLQLSARPFTAFRGQEVAPSFSPDGSQIAFAWTGEKWQDEFDLYVKVMGSETPLRLTTRPAKGMSPAWSPDGRRIAFSRAGGDGRGIYMLPALGGPERKLLDVRSGTFDYFVRASLSWSPDGKLLAFSDADVPSGPPVIALLNVDTLERRRLDPPSKACAWVWAPAFSPTGRFLAVACVLGIDRNELFVLPAAGGTARSIGVVQGSFSGLAWAADETHVVFTCDGNVWRVSAGGGEPEVLLPGRDARSPAVSRGGRLAYAQWAVNTNIWRVPLASPTRSAGPPERLFTSSRVQRYPTFSPDGRRLAFESTRSGTVEIWMSNADGSDPVPVTSFGGPLTGSPQWSPDGRQIALDSRAGGEAAVYIASLEGGPPRRFATGIRESSVPAWSGDGRWLYFSAGVAEAGQIFKAPTEGGSAIQLTKRGGIFPRPSRDGQRVYYVKYKDDALWSVSVNGGDERPVSGMPRRSAEWCVDWALVASGIYFVDGDPPRPGIHFFEFATRRTTRIVDTPGQPEPWWGGLALSPDGRSLLYSQRDEIASDIMLVEDFR